MKHKKAKGGKKSKSMKKPVYKPKHEITIIKPDWLTGEELKEFEELNKIFIEELEIEPENIKEIKTK